MFKGMRDENRYQPGTSVPREREPSWNVVTVTLTWIDGREIRVRVGEDLVADAPAFAAYVQRLVSAMGGLEGMQGE